MTVSSSVRLSSSKRTDEVPYFEFVSSSIGDELNSKVRTGAVSGGGIVTNWNRDELGIARPAAWVAVEAHRPPSPFVRRVWRRWETCAPPRPVPLHPV